MYGKFHFDKSARVRAYWSLVFSSSSAGFTFFPYSRAVQNLCSQYSYKFTMRYFSWNTIRIEAKKSRTKYTPKQRATIQMQQEKKRACISKHSALVITTHLCNLYAVFTIQSTTTSFICVQVSVCLCVWEISNQQGKMKESRWNE